MIQSVEDVFRYLIVYAALVVMLIVVALYIVATFIQILLTGRR